MVVEPRLRAPVPAVVEVNQDLGSGGQRGVFHTPSSGVQDSCNVAVAVCSSQGPYQAAADFVADGDDLYVELVVCKRVAY